MIGNSFPEYVFIRGSIACLRLIAPASFLYLVLCVWSPWIYWFPLVVYSALEASFYAFVYLPRSYRLQAPPTYTPQTLTRRQREQLFERCISYWGPLPSGLPYPSGWFLPCGKSPRREDVIDWLLWALFSLPRTEAAVQSHKEELTGYVSRIETLLGSPLPDGHADNCSSMKVTLDPVLMLHRPLLWYFIVALVDIYTSIALVSLGFRHYVPRESEWRLAFPPRLVSYLVSSPGPEGVSTPYWYRPHRSKHKNPVVFLHGIGIGLYPYVPFLKSLQLIQPDVGMLIPELLPISFHITPCSAPPRPLMSRSMCLILEDLQRIEEQANVATSMSSDTDPLLSGQNHPSGWARVVFVAHSYGTFIGGWLIRDLVDEGFPTTSDTLSEAEPKSFARHIAHMVLIDPIPILLSNPAVAHNFLYRHPSTALRAFPPDGLPSPVATPNGTSSEETRLGCLTLNPLPFSPPTHSLASAWQLWYFASRDPDVARTLGRTFFWAEGGIWKDEIYAFLDGVSLCAQPAMDDDALHQMQKGRNIAVVLAGQDQIIPADAIRRHLTGEEHWTSHWVGNASGRLREPLTNGVLEVLFNPTLDHANIFDHDVDYDPLLDVVVRYVENK